MNNLEPRSIEPGYLRRWLRLSVALVLRAPFAWCLVSLMWVLGCDLIRQSVWSLFFGIFMTIMTIEVACTVDFQKMTWSSYLHCIKESWRLFQVWLFQNKIYALSIAIFFLAIDHMFVKSPEIIEAHNNRSVYISAAIGLMHSFIVINRSTFSLLWHPISQATKCEDKDVVENICISAWKKNISVSLFLSFTPIIFCTLVIIFFPYASILLFLFYPLSVYFAFREIFWGIQENKKQVEANINQMSVQM